MESPPRKGSELYPLANAKGSKLLCELCQKPAFLQCSQCRVTYYCSVDHQTADWIGIHQKICEKLIPLRKPLPFMTLEDDRKNRKAEMRQQQEAMIELTRTTGQKLLFEGRYEEAVPAALQSLKFAIDVHGIASVELVNSYLILGEASIGLSRLPQAEEYLSQAQWTVLKNADCSHSIKSKLHRNLGLLFKAKHEYDSALEHIAHDIFHASEDYHPDDIHVSGGYYYMAEVFDSLERMDIADGLYSRVVDIWYDHLRNIFLILTTPPEIPEGIGEVVAEITQEEKETLDEAQQAEAIKVLNCIFEVREQQLEASAYTRARITLALAMLYFVLGDSEKSRGFASTANDVAQNVDDQSFLDDLALVLDKL